MTGTLPRERRQRRRAVSGRLVRFDIGRGVMTATVEDLSETGMRLETPWVPPLDAEIEVQLPLRSREGKLSTCTLRARVVRQRESESEIGVAFIDLLPRHMLQLRDYVHRAEPHLGL